MGASVSYEEFESAELKKARQEQQAYAAARRRTVEQEIQSLAAATDTARTAKTAQTRRSQQENTVEATGEYAKNGLQYAVTRRQWQQRLSDMGLTDSGLQQTAQRVAAGEKTAADEETRREWQQSNTALSQALTTWEAAQEASQQEAAAKLRAAAEKEIAQHEASLTKAAKSRATSQYKAALSAAAKGVTAG